MCWLYGLLWLLGIVYTFSVWYVVERVVILVSERAVPSCVFHLFSVAWRFHCVGNFLVRCVCLCLYLLCVEAVRLAVVLGGFDAVTAFAGVSSWWVWLSIEVY